jgi:hypothetical protein
MASEWVSSNAAGAFGRRGGHRASTGVTKRSEGRGCGGRASRTRKTVSCWCQGWYACMPLLHLRGVPLGGPEGYGTHPRVLGRYTPAVECVSTNINGSKARYRILNLMKRPLHLVTSALWNCTTLRSWVAGAPRVWASALPARCHVPGMIGMPAGPVLQRLRRWPRGAWCTAISVQPVRGCT